jgi:uncharacterized protein
VAGKEPIRTCTGCGEARPKDEMVRVAVDPAGRAFPDLSGKAPGRGAYVCPRRECLESAARGRLAAVLKAKGLPGADAGSLASSMASAFRTRALSLLGLAQRQGAALSGTAMAEGELRKGPRGWGLLVVAEDASADVTEKVIRRAREEGLSVQSFLSRDEIGQAMGKSPRSAVLCKGGSLARALEESIVRARAVSPESPQEESGNG